MKKYLKYIVVLLILFIIPITTINAKTIADIEREIKEAEKKLNDTNVKKAATQQDINETTSKINKINKDVEQINTEIDAKTKESEQLEKDIAKKNEEIKDLMRYYQISSSGSAMLEYIMGAKSITDLVYRLSITEQISTYNKKAIKEMNDMIAENEKIKKELASKKEELATLKSELNTQLAVLTKKKGELDKDGISEENNIKEMKKELQHYKDMKCDVNDTIEACLAKNSKNNQTGYLPPGTTFYRPTVSGRITSEFGKRTLFGAANNHFAIDISVPIGTPVYSVAPGVVGATGTICGYSVVVWHYVNGSYYSSLYCHLSAFKASVGQTVTKDTVIALSGNTGISTGPHLHLGLATGKYRSDYFLYYGSSSSFESHTFNPRNVITFPALGSSYYNR